MKDAYEKIPVSGFVIFGTLSLLMLGVLPFPFVIYHMKLHNRLVSAVSDNNQNLAKVTKVRMRFCCVLIIICVLIEIAVFVYLMRRFYVNLDELVSYFINSGCSDCTGK